MVIFQVFTNCRVFVFSDSLKEMLGCVTNIIWITQITCIFVNNTMLVNKGRFDLYRFDVINDFSAGKHWVQVTSNFPAKFAEIPSELDNDDIGSLKRRSILIWLLSILKCFAKPYIIRK